MASLLYLFGIIGLAASAWAFFTAPVLMGAPVIGAFVGSVLLLGVGRLIELTNHIERNTHDTADQLRKLRGRED